MVPKNIPHQLVSPHSSVDKAVSVNFSLLSGHEFESPKELQGKRRARLRLKKKGKSKNVLTIASINKKIIMKIKLDRWRHMFFPRC